MVELIPRCLPDNSCSAPRLLIFLRSSAERSAIPVTVRFLRKIVISLFLYLYRISFDWRASMRNFREKWSVRQGSYWNRFRCDKRLGFSLPVKDPIDDTERLLAKKPPIGSRKWFWKEFLIWKHWKVSRAMGFLKNFGKRYRNFRFRFYFLIHLNLIPLNVI